MLLRRVINHTAMVTSSPVTPGINYTSTVHTASREGGRERGVVWEKRPVAKSESGGVRKGKGAQGDHG